jgi:hypothetical protein
MTTSHAMPESTSALAALTELCDAAAWIAASMREALKKSDLRFMSEPCALQMTGV